jgi:hypothetical protein
VLFEALASDDAGLGQAVHPFPNFDVDPTILNETEEFVLVGRRMYSNPAMGVLR